MIFLKRNKLMTAPYEAALKKFSDELDTVFRSPEYNSFPNTYFEFEGRYFSIYEEGYDLGADHMCRRNMDINKIPYEDPMDRAVWVYGYDKAQADW